MVRARCRNRYEGAGVTAAPESRIGASVQRLEDLPLLTGHKRFAGDTSFPRQLHIRVVRSAYAHGCVKDINTAARSLPV
jgi:aerobic carbon-monoxide dehydrogenase large subunit